MFVCIDNPSLIEKKNEQIEDLFTENVRNENSIATKSREIKSESQDDERSDDDIFDFGNSAQSFSSKSMH